MYILKKLSNVTSSIKEKEDMLKNIILIAVKAVEKLEKLEKECKEEGVNFYYVMPEEDTLIQETLYITDNKEIAKNLLEEEANVLVWLHEDNREQDFSRLPYAIEGIEEMDYCYLYRIYQRFQKLPWLIAETKRCRIREMTEEDLDAIYEIYSGKDITKYMEDLYEDREKELEYIRCYIAHEYTFWGYGTWIVERKQDDKVIGRVGFNMRDGFEQPELGFVIGEEYQRQGYALECCMAALNIGKEDYEFEEVQALIKEGNVASIELCKKLGFVFENEVVVDGGRYLRYCIKI